MKIIEPLKIITVDNDPDGVLRKKCEPLEKPLDRRTVEEMRSLIVIHHGSGLALPQVGISKDGFMARIGGRLRMFYNPEILRVVQYKPYLQYREGCLSIPGKTFLVSRPYSIEIQFRDEKFKWVHAAASGPDARVFMHELEHLVGVLISDKKEVEGSNV